MNQIFTRRFLVFFLLMSFIVGCENDLKEVTTINKKVTQVEEGKNINTLLTTGGKLKANLKAPLMFRYITDSPYFEFPEGIHVDMYKDSISIETVVVSRYCKYLESQSKVFLRDSVRVNNMDGDTLWCKQMWWDQQKRIFYSDDTTWIYKKTGNVRQKGIGFMSKQNLDSFSLFRPLGRMDFPK